jgi:predicted alpha/beta superfamily hydrolase
MRRSGLTLFLLFAISFSFAQTGGSKRADSTRPFVLGVIDEFRSQVMGEKRILNIYLPEGYNPKDTIKYPVVYLLDGSADEDFIHVVGLYQFESFEWINHVPKSIIVGIATVDRRRDLTFPSTSEADKKHNPTSGGSARFMQFIEKELQPYIDRKYKTTASRTLIGQSLGGLFATEVLLKKPAMFDQYIIISPSLWWDNGSLLAYRSPVLTKDYVKPTRIYIGVGKEGLTPAIPPSMMVVDADLLAEKINKIDNPHLQVHFDYLPDKDHATSMHQALYNALEHFNQSKK